MMFLLNYLLNKLLRIPKNKFDKSDAGISTIGINTRYNGAANFGFDIMGSKISVRFSIMTINLNIAEKNASVIPY